MTSAVEKTSNGEGENTSDDRGLKFGADTAEYDSDSEYVASLPTEEEERRILAGEKIRANEEIEDLDEGRASNHPSTLAVRNKSSSAAMKVGFEFCSLHDITALRPTHVSNSC